MQAPTSDQIRNAIDSGVTGEKVSMPDPAAAPLGTDDEAAGNPPSGAERAMAARQMPEALRDPPRALPGGAVYIGLVLVVAILLVTIVFLGLP